MANPESILSVRFSSVYSVHSYIQYHIVKIFIFYIICILSGILLNHDSRAELTFFKCFRSILHNFDCKNIIVHPMKFLIPNNLFIKKLNFI